MRRAEEANSDRSPALRTSRVQALGGETEVKSLFKKFEAECRRSFLQTFSKGSLPSLVAHYFRQYRKEKACLWLIDLATKRGRSNMSDAGLDQVHILLLHIGTP